MPETLEAMREGRCGIGPLDFRDVDRLSIQIGGQVHGLRGRRAVSTASRWRFTTGSPSSPCSPPSEAIAQSGLNFCGRAGRAARAWCWALPAAASAPGTTTTASVYEEGKNRVHPFVVPKLMNNAAASHVSMEYNLKGPSFTVVTACASSNHAMAQAFQMVRSGMAPAMVTGGSESMLCFGGVKAWEGLRVMSKDACRPFSRQPQRHGAGRRGGGLRVRGLRPRPRARGRDPGRGGRVSPCPRTPPIS